MHRPAILQVAAAEERAAQRGEDLAFLVLDISATNFIDADTVQMLKASRCCCCRRCCCCCCWPGRKGRVLVILHVPQAGAAAVAVASCSAQHEGHLPACCCCHRI